MSVAMFLSLQGEPVQSDRTEEETGQVSAQRSDELYWRNGRLFTAEEQTLL